MRPVALALFAFVGVLDDELHKQDHVGAKSVIGLQIHSNDQIKLRFKDIWIKEL